MHIGFQKSGDRGGRGEYEIVGSASGYRAQDLEAWRFNLRWPDGMVRETAIELESGESGKPRLRSQQPKKYQIGRMVSAMLLLPDPIRERAKTRSALPVASAKGFILSRLGFGPDTEFDGVTDLVTIDPTYVEISNLVETESIGVEQRWARVVQIHAAAEAFPPAVRLPLLRHQGLVSTGDLLTTELTQTVNQLRKSMAAEFHSYDAAHDPLPELEHQAGIVPTEVPDLPPPDKLGEEESDVKARSAHQYRLAKVRGPAHRQFSLDVRQAYSHRCAFCGGKYGGVSGVRSGLEAAHILAWSKYTADVLKNGMSLCKTHHWAFDAGLMVPEYDQGSYRIRFTKLSEQFERESMARLGQDGFVIPDDWFPTDISQRPDRKYLDILYRDLSIELIA